MTDTEFATPESDVPAPEAATPPTLSASERQRILLGALVGTALYLAFFFGMMVFNAHSPHIPAQYALVWSIIALFSTVTYLFLLVNCIRTLCYLPFSIRETTLAMCLSFLLFMVLNPAIRYVFEQLMRGADLWQTLATLTQVKSYWQLDLLVPFLLILTGVFFGQLLARLIRESSLLVPVALVAGLVDFWGVYWGPVSVASEKAGSAVSAMAAAATATAAVPEAARTSLPPTLAFLASIAPPDNIGVGDFVFLAFFLACAVRLGFSVTRSMWGIFSGLLLASLIYAANGMTIFGHQVAIEYLPGLVFISGGLLLANIGTWRLTRQEWAMTGVLVAIFVAFIGLSIGHAVIEDRAERRNVPREVYLQYQLSAAPPPSTVIARVLAKLPDDLKEKSERPLTPQLVQGVFRYRNAGKRSVLDAWRLLVLGRTEPLAPRTAWGFDVQAGLMKDAPARWSIDQMSQSPPASLLEVLRAKAAKGKKADDRTLLSGAGAVPAAALALLDNGPAYARLVPGSPVFMLVLRADGADLLNEKKTVVHHFTYPR